MAEFDPSRAAESFFQQRERGRQEINQEAAQAAAVAEMLGYYTPELQQKVTQPLGQNPTVGENLLGAPVRGLGNLFGNEAMQQYGATQPFDLGQAQPQQAPQYPQIPPGTDPQTRELLESIGLEMGLSPPQKAEIVPGVPSETIGQPRLKTKVERDAERFQQEQVWDLIMKNYQTEQQRRQVEAEIQQAQAAAELNFSTSLLNQQKFQNGPTKTETQAFLDSLPEINEQRTAAGKRAWTYFDMQKSLKEASRSPAKGAAKVQWFELAKQYIPSLTPIQWEQMIAQAKWDPYEVANKIFYHRDSLLPFMDEMNNPDGTPNEEARRAFITEMALGSIDVMNTLNEKRRANGESLLWKDEPVTIPPQLKASGVTMEELQQFMLDFKIPTIGQAIQMYMDLYEDTEAQRKR
jgi:hypothetical protein